MEYNIDVNIIIYIINLYIIIIKINEVNNIEEFFYYRILLFQKTQKNYAFIRVSLNLNNSKKYTNKSPLNYDNTFPKNHFLQPPSQLPPPSTSF